jgi:hypothetical protein
VKVKTDRIAIDIRLPLGDRNEGEVTAPSFLTRFA